VECKNEECKKEVEMFKGKLPAQPVLLQKDEDTPLLAVSVELDIELCPECGAASVDANVFNVRV
jgi:hypothetical protein